MDGPKIRIYEDLCDFYEDLHTGRERELRFYSMLLPHPGARVLDLACGTGVIADRLVAAGGVVTAVDASEKMLARARCRPAPVQWLLGDMRDFRMSKRFDLVICGLNSMQHLETDADVLLTMQCVKDHLVPGGHFAFDIFNPAESFLVAPRHNTLMRQFSSAVIGRDLALFEDTRYDDATQLLYVDWRIVDPESGTVIASSGSKMRQIFPAAVDQLLEASGFVKIATYGDFDATPFEPAHAKQIIIARAM